MIDIINILLFLHNSNCILIMVQAYSVGQGKRSTDAPP